MRPINYMSRNVRKYIRFTKNAHRPGLKARRISYWSRLILKLGEKMTVIERDQLLGCLPHN